MLVGRSTGGGEVVRYVGRHGTARVSKIVLVGAVPPIMISTAAYPGGLPMSLFDGIRKDVAEDRSQFFRNLMMPFFGSDRKDAKVSQGMRDGFWLQGMMGSLKSEYDCIAAFSETDFTDDFRTIDVPTLVIQRDDDQLVPIEHTGRLTAKIVRSAALKVDPGGSRGWRIPRATSSVSTCSRSHAPDRTHGLHR